MIYIQTDQLTSKLVIASPTLKGVCNNFILTGADGSMLTSECVDVSESKMVYELIPLSAASFDFSNLPVGEYTMTLRYDRTELATLTASLSKADSIDIYYDEEKKVNRIPSYNIAYDDLIGKPIFKTVNGERIDNGPGNIIIDGSGGIISIDTTLSDTSTNPVENRVITQKIREVESKIPTIPEFKTVNGERIDNGPGNIEIKAGVSDWSEITNKPEFKPVATTGSYTDLINKPNIPTDNKQLANGAGYVTDADVVAKDYATNTKVTEVENIAKSKTTIAEVEAKGYETSASVDTKLEHFNPTDNFKTINNESIIGKGNIEIQGGGTVSVDQAFDSTSERAIANKVVTEAVTSRNLKAVDQTELSTVEIPTACVTEERVIQLISNQPNEIWEFELEDGSTIQKNVVLK